jgi:segregation and condensation protein B
MEELETSPQGVSPEPEPAPPVVEEAVPEAPQPGTTGQEACPTTSLEDPVPEPPADDAAPEPTLSVDELMATSEVKLDDTPAPVSHEDSQIRAILEAIVYVAEEPLTLAQIAASLQQPMERVKDLLDQLIAEFDQPGHGVSIREVAGGYKMATKPEHHEAVRNFVKSLKPPLKLSLPALETLAVIAYKQPATGPEIMEIRGVQGGGVLKTLLDRKLIAVAGRKNVIGKPMLYKTTKEFLIQFGLKDLSELPSLKEFEEIRRMAFSDSETPAEEPATEPVPAITSAGEPVEAPAEATEPVAEPTLEAPAVEAVAETPEATPEATPVSPVAVSAPNEEN